MLTFYLLKTTASGENELGQEIFEHKRVAVFTGYSRTPHGCVD